MKCYIILLALVLLGCKKQSNTTQSTFTNPPNRGSIKVVADIWYNPNPLYQDSVNYMISFPYNNYHGKTKLTHMEFNDNGGIGAFVGEMNIGYADSVRIVVYKAGLMIFNQTSPTGLHSFYIY